MNELNKILTTINRPFHQELKTGCQDDVVINGIEAYVSLWVENATKLELNTQQTQFLNRLNELFQNYSNLSTTDRENILQEASKVINAALTGDFNLLNIEEGIEQKPELKSDNNKSTAEHKKSTPTDLKQIENLPLFRKSNQSEVRTPSTEKPQTSSVPSTEPTGNINTPPASFDTIKPSIQEIELENNNLPVIISDTPVSIDADSLELFNNPLKDVNGIGPKRAEVLSDEIEIHTVGGILEYYPRDYLDRSKIVDIYSLGRSEDGAPETIQGKVVNHVTQPPVAKGKKSIGKVSIFDGTGVAVLVNFGRRIGYIKSILPIDTEVVISGKFTRRYNEIQTTDYEFEIFDEDNLIHTKRIVPKYPLTAKLTAKLMRTAIRNVLNEIGDNIPEILPIQLRQTNQLIDRQQAMNEIHFPTSDNYRMAAQRRLAFDEFFLLSLGMEMRKDNRTAQNGIQFEIDHTDTNSLLNRFIDSLPFELTRAQSKVFEEIREDMKSPRVMNRLIQGDVGSGKTVVAAMSLLCAIENGYQGALMVPTEILAEQHHQNLLGLLSPLGLKVVLLKSDLPKSERDEVMTSITDGCANLIVGTQALIQEGVEFSNLGLVIVDEQHRFGVMQRAMLRGKGKSSTNENLSPDVLVMTATPIPRTLSLTVYGDLNVSVIDELPPGRQKIETQWVKEKDRGELYIELKKDIKNGKQAYIVYPLVEESEKLEELKAATKMAEHIQKDVFPDLRIGLLHGQMKSVEKQDIMAQFNAQEIDILVATTVIEVGIDVPNATIMVIENAERFGLAQLHQLRGRVGRGSDKSYCYLVATPKTDESYRRIQVMVRSNNGFEIAEEDLNIRGPGEFFGTRQSGMPTFKIANIISDAELLEAAKKEAMNIIQKDPQLNQPEHQLMKKMLHVHWKGHLEIASVG
ncbi:DNA helicase RecG [Candidatus Poribacteria bacterium]|nr:MAG: DNA helicase RecG [Candidatus Poribacteria bacterium]